MRDLQCRYNFTLYRNFELLYHSSWTLGRAYKLRLPWANFLSFYLFMFVAVVFIVFSLSDCVLCFIAGAIRFLIHFLSPHRSLAAVSASGSSVMAPAHGVGEKETPLRYTQDPQIHGHIYGHVHTCICKTQPFSELPPHRNQLQSAVLSRFVFLGFLSGVYLLSGLCFLLSLFVSPSLSLSLSLFADFTDLINEHIALTGYLLLAPTDLFWLRTQQMLGNRFATGSWPFYKQMYIKNRLLIEMHTNQSTHTAADQILPTPFTLPISSLAKS